MADFKALKNTFIYSRKFRNNRESELIAEERRLERPILFLAAIISARPRDSCW